MSEMEQDPKAVSGGEETKSHNRMVIEQESGNGGP
jgi:hypothetical protein